MFTFDNIQSKQLNISALVPFGAHRRLRTWLASRPPPQANPPFWPSDQGGGGSICSALLRLQLKGVVFLQFVRYLFFNQIYINLFDF